MNVAQIRPEIWSFYAFHSYYSAQVQRISTSPREWDIHIMQQPTGMLHQVCPYVLLFRSLRGRALGDQALAQYQMVIHANRRPTSRHIRLYNGPTCSEVVAIVSSAKEEECSRRFIVRH